MKKSILAVLICSGLLTACSSGGSSDNSSGPIDNTSKPSDSSPSHTVYSEKQDVTYTESKIAKALNPKVDIEEAPTSIADSYDINKIYINNTIVTLIPSGVTVAKFLNIKSDNYKNAKVVSGRNFNPVRFGYIQNKMFAHGETSTDVPTTGEATYKGKVIAVALPTTDDGKINTDIDTNIVTGDSNIKVNFETKNLEANFTNFAADKTGYKIKDITFNGDIYKRKSEPDVKSFVYFSNNDFNESNQLQGAFYGKNAEAVAGIFNKKTDGHYIEASFGAKKQ